MDLGLGPMVGQSHGRIPFRRTVVLQAKAEQAGSMAQA